MVIKMSYEIEKAKAQQACDILKEQDIDAWLVWVRETSQMADPVLDLIFGGDLTWQSALIFTEDEKIAIVGNFDEAGVKAKGIYDTVIPYTAGIREELVKQLSRKDPKRIAINYSVDDVAADGLSVGMHMLLQEYLKNTPFATRFMSAENHIQKLRGRKTAEEVSRIRRAIEITEEIYEKVRKFVKVGLSEMEIYNFFHKCMKEYEVSSAWDVDHCPAVDAGPYKQFGHAGPIDNETKQGHLLHFDFGVKHKAYCSDIQRMLFFGDEKDIPAEVQDAFETVRDGIQAAADWIRPGAVGYEVDNIARDFVKAAGYEEYQHALGHQLGRLAHDGGTLLGPKWERYGDSPMGVVEVGNVFTLEFYVTTEHYGQVSLEEDILITRQGCEFLSKPQKDLICIK
ncbi:MAG: aminopeptidase P family protein [Candidatus Thorarchaeota archaeon]|nr:aminopeptidase P family protein [Candidatus Thorarchaeota archaeon]